MANSSNEKKYTAYLVTPTVDKNGKPGDDFWLAFSNAYPHKDDGFTVPLNRIGQNAKIIIREKKEKSDQDS